MNRNQKTRSSQENKIGRNLLTHAFARACAVVGGMALAWLVMGASVIGAEPPAPDSPADSPSESRSVAVLNDATLWRDFVVPRCIYVRTADGKLEPWDFALSSTGWQLLTFEPAASTAPWVTPPAQWVSPTFEDSAWERVRLPKPVPKSRRPHMQGGFPAVLLVRGKFEVKDPVQVKSCRLSLEYWGGVAVYLNGKEVARGHLPANQTNLADAVAEDYPAEAWTNPKGKPLLHGDKENADRLALRDRKLEVEIPTALLREGLNVLAIQVDAAPMDFRAFNKQGYDWPPVGLLSARLTESPPDVAAANVLRPQGIQVWNCAPYDTVTAFDYGDRTELLRPVTVHAARNGVFSGRLMVSSDQPIKGLMVSVTDLVQAQGRAKLPASTVRVRYAVAAEPGKDWLPGYRFDGLLDAIPAVIPVAGGLSQDEIEHPEQRFFHWRYDRNVRLGIPGAAAPLWFTVRVPKDAEPGTYEGTVRVSAEGLKPTTVPLRVSVSAWTMPDPKDFRVHNFVHHSPDSVARHYGVPLWSDKHFELMGKSLALMVEVGSRQVYANLAVEYWGNRFVPSNAESLVRWIRQPDGSYKHDFTVFDKYLDMVARYVGEPFPLQLNCWGELPGPGKGEESWGGWGGVKGVSLLDPATGRIDCMKQPLWGTEESYEFWRPVFDEILKKLKARGWLKVTAMGWNTVNTGVPEEAQDIARRLWPDCVWSLTSHEALAEDALFRHGVYSAGKPSVRGYRELLKPRQKFTSFWGAAFGWGSPLTDCRRVVEDVIMSGHDGLGRFGADLFPLKNAQGGYSYMACGWPRNPRDLMGMALLYPGPHGPVATESYEMFREGVELCEALLFIERAIQNKKLSPELQQRAESYLEDRDNAFIKNWFLIGGMPGPEEDANLLDLAGEVARVLGQK